MERLMSGCPRTSRPASRRRSCTVTTRPGNMMCIRASRAWWRARLGALHARPSHGDLAYTHAVSPGQRVGRLRDAPLATGIRPRRTNSAAYCRAPGAPHRSTGLLHRVREFRLPRSRRESWGVVAGTPTIQRALSAASARVRWPKPAASRGSRLGERRCAPGAQATSNRPPAPMRRRMHIVHTT